MSYMRCTFCGSGQHMLKHCPKTWNGQTQRNLLRCSYCGARNHTNKSCPRLGAEHAIPGEYVLDK